jgi:bacillithiol biosynthesis deacetylase BshB1
MNLDVLIFTAHPDDAELAMGGTIALMTISGIRVGVIDLSQGEMSTRGTIETRKQETVLATEILGLTFRENLKLPDGNLRPDDKYIRDVVRCIRKYKPKIIFGPYFEDRHPDHEGVSKIVKSAMFFCGAGRYVSIDDNKEQTAYRPSKLFYYMQAYKFKPSFIIDITDYFEIKMKSVYAYKTQFYDPSSTEPATYISDPKFVKYLEARSRFYGFQIGKEYGEPFFSEDDVELSILNLLKEG